ncbi:MAG: hydrolase, partial [bacterium]
NRTRPKNNIGFHEMRPHISYRGFWDFEGFQETGFLHVDSHWEWKNGYEIHTGINFTKEGVKEPFELGGIEIPAATYDHAEAQIVGNTNRGKPVSFSTRITAGGFFGGDRFAASNTLNLRFGETFTTQLRYKYNNIDLPHDSLKTNFHTNLVSLRASYSFTPRIYLQGLIQYNDSADIWSTNLRFGWLQSANTGLFLVYNEVQDLDNGLFSINNRSFIVKYSYLFDVFN